MIDNETIDKLIGLSIVDVVSDYVTLKRAGANYKGVCPFHEDSSPSFYVSPAKNICHCFACGEGGNPVTFIMKHEKCDFPQACKILGDKYHIKVEDREPRELTKEERELQEKRESGFVIFEYVQKHFVECLYADTPEAKAALSYAVYRWGEEEVKERGIGYAPKDWQDIIKFAESEGLSIPLMKEMHLISTSEKGNDYGFYNDRLMIPIRDKYGRIISYTARTMDEHKEKGSKYVNGAESFIYNKGEVLFGLDVAQKEGAKQELFYIVEGAPDVIKLQEIGITNAIAALGTAFTAEQLQLLKRYRCTLCFIPDQDGPGIEAVKKNGRLAMEAGFRVTVKEIPPLVDEDGTEHKQDADSYFKRSKEGNKNSAAAQLDAITTEDYVIWLARHVYNEEQTDTAKSDSVREICSALILEKDEFTLNGLLDALADKYGHKSLWKNAVNDAKRIRNEEKAKKSSQRSGIDLRTYGFYEEHNAYWSNEDNSARQWSNFKMKPLFHIMGVDDSRRLYEITNSDGTTRTLELNAEELVSLPKFMIKVESVGNFLWLAGAEELKKLKRYLYSNTGTAVSISQYGWQRRGFWAFGNGCIYENEWYPADHMGIVHLHEADKTQDNYYLQGSSDIYAEDTSYFTFERQFIMPEEHSSIALPKFASMMAEVFGDNAKIGLCYLLSSLFRDIITSYTTNFPLLNLFGPKGSGKSQLGITLMRFFTIGDEPTNLKNTTPPGLSQILAQTRNGLVHLDEYKNTLDPRFVEIIKGAYDGVGRSRLDMDHGKKVEKTPVNCGVIVGGQEMPTLDIAMFSRMIYLARFDRLAMRFFDIGQDPEKLAYWTQRYVTDRICTARTPEDYKDLCRGPHYLSRKFQLYVYEGVPLYFRFVDNIIIRHADRTALHIILEMAVMHLARDWHVTLNRDYNIRPCWTGIRIAGYVFFPDHVEASKRNKQELARHVRKLQKLGFEEEQIRVKLASRFGYVKHANSIHLFKTLGMEKSLGKIIKNRRVRAPFEGMAGNQKVKFSSIVNLCEHGGVIFKILLIDYRVMDSKIDRDTYMVQVENSEGGQQMVEKSRPNKALAIRFKHILRTFESGGEEQYVFEKKKDEQGNPTDEDAEFYSFTGSKILIDQALNDFSIEDLPCPTVIQQYKGKNGQTFVKFT